MVHKAHTPILISELEQTARELRIDSLKMIYERGQGASRGTLSLPPRSYRAVSSPCSTSTRPARLGGAGPFPSQQGTRQRHPLRGAGKERLLSPRMMSSRPGASWAEPAPGAPGPPQDALVGRHERRLSRTRYQHRRRLCRLAAGIKRTRLPHLCRRRATANARRG